MTAGGTAEGFEKRIGAELMGGGSVVFFDNIDDRGFKSDTLASALAERPARVRVRVLGRSAMVPLNASAFVVPTGDALDVGEDLARRFVRVELDAHREDPEARRFDGDLLVEVGERRAESLAARLTVRRWRRQQEEADALAHGRPMGSFGAWCRWVRDPLLAPGCQDPALRVAEAGARDAGRRHVAEVFDAWWRVHGARPVTVAELAPAVARFIDPQGRSRQYLARAVGNWDGAGGFVLTRQPAAGRWNAATYQLRPTAAEAPGPRCPRTDPGDGAEACRTHRTHPVPEAAHESDEAYAGPAGRGTPDAERRIGSINPLVSSNKPSCPLLGRAVAQGCRMSDESVATAPRDAGLHSCASITSASRASAHNASASPATAIRHSPGPRPEVSSSRLMPPSRAWPRAPCRARASNPPRPVRPRRPGLRTS